MTQTRHDEPGHSVDAKGLGTDHVAGDRERGTTATDTPRPEITDEQALIEEARHRQRRRHLWIAAIIVLAVVGSGLGLWLGRNTNGPSPQKVHRSTTSSPPPPATSAPPGLDRPTALAVTSNGDLLIANQGTNQILRRLPDGTFQIVAGTGKAGYSGDGGPAVRAELNMPNGIAVAPDGTIYVADTANNRVRAISPSGTISTWAGNGSAVASNGRVGVGPSGAHAVDATLADPLGVAVGPQGQLYVADSAGIQVVSPGGVLTTLKPSGLDPLVFGTGGFIMASAIAADPAGNLYVADFSPKMLVELSSTGSVLHSWSAYVAPGGLATAPDGSILVADYGFSVDRISNAALTPIATFSLDSIPGITGAFRPSGVAVSSTGMIYVDTDGANGGTNTPALAALNPQGQVRVLATGTNTYVHGG